MSENFKCMKCKHITTKPTQAYCVYCGYGIKVHNELFEMVFKPVNV